MNRMALLVLGVIVMLLGVSTSVAGGKYLMKPDSNPIPVSTSTKTTPSKTDTQSQFKGHLRINRLQRLHRSKSIQSTFRRMKRKHFIHG